jgi:hypothetical protein
MHEIAAGQGEWRRPTETEAACVSAVAMELGDLVEELEGLRVRSGCRCGCGTLDLLPAGATEHGEEPASPAPMTIDVLDDEGEVAGGILLFLKGGHLSTIEIYSFDDRPLQLPSPERLRFGGT